MRPVLILNPRQDDEFVSFAEGLAAQATSLAALQASLRERYPAATVRPRLLSSDSGDVWYVYRDGRWVSGTAEEGQA
jgi:hypothetical protein